MNPSETDAHPSDKAHTNFLKNSLILSKKISLIRIEVGLWVLVARERGVAY